MARGDGPRLIVEIGVDLKRRLHGRLALEGRTVKSWLTERIESFLSGEQLPLALPTGTPTSTALIEASLSAPATAAGGPAPAAAGPPRGRSASKVRQRPNRPSKRKRSRGAS